MVVGYLKKYSPLEIKWRKIEKINKERLKKEWRNNI